MVRCIFLLTLCLSFLAACEKSSDEKSNHESLTGRWNYSQSYYSPGSGLIYTSTENLRQWIDFGSGGSFSSNMPQFKDVTSYEILDSTKIKLTNPTALSSERFFFRLNSTAHTLTLSSADHICIEGCGSVFKR